MVISVINYQKNVGKSSICMNTAHAISKNGRRVLVVDQDPQAYTTSVLAPGIKRMDTLYSVYKYKTDIERCIFATQYRFDILPNDLLTTSLELHLHHDITTSYNLLKLSLQEILQNYDFIIIDCPPNLGLWTIMALVASDAAIIPIDAATQSQRASFVQPYKRVLALTQQIGSPRLLKVLLNNADLRTTISRLPVRLILDQLKANVLETILPRSSDIRKAQTAGCTLLRYAGGSLAARRFRRLADEILSMVEEDDDTSNG